MLRDGVVHGLQGRLKVCNLVGWHKLHRRGGCRSANLRLDMALLEDVHRKREGQGTSGMDGVGWVVKVESQQPRDHVSQLATGSQAEVGMEVVMVVGVAAPRPRTSTRSSPHSRRRHRARPEECQGTER